MNRKALIIGGTSGLGLSIGKELYHRGYEKIILLGRNNPIEDIYKKMEYVKFDLLKDDYNEIQNIINKYQIDTLIISSGIGRVSHFADIEDSEIVDMFTVNVIAPVRIVKMFYSKLLNEQDINCVIISSISGIVSSPLFSVYSATKASLNKFVEAINIELEKYGTSNKVLNVSPGCIQGTSFESKKNNNSLLTKELSNNIINNMLNKKTIYIPKYNEIYKEVIERYIKNPHKFGLESYEYKIKNNRINKK